ncbi:MAG: hypothetical protein KAG89_10345 [Fulvimarina manganoxydans]|uniref:hypothetical protein n=1 Tax=Fulvimarina manganoxydans TaxID=937218 RepID=UPI0023552AEF|nr:hypothetical protein [Fulvimarina manganoxydans]MCK5932555.1 hypothetical protein [Fulvimarina manganoxydans]MEE2950934.1 hypothetical protein [Pseudomonadota bacterium]
MNDADKRAKRMERVLKVQVQKRQIEEWTLTHLKQKHAEIDQADREILQSLDPSSELHGLFVDAKVKSLRRNDLARRDNLKAQAETEGRLREARRGEKGVEKRRDEARREAGSVSEAKTLASNVDAFLARVPAPGGRR